MAPGMGVRFDSLTPDSQGRLERLLEDKQKRGEQSESRFDAGVRQASSNYSPIPSQATPTGHKFGDEPTRAASADQINRLAEASLSRDDGEVRPPAAKESVSISGSLRQLKRLRDAQSRTDGDEGA